MKQFLADVAKITYGFPFSSAHFNESEGMSLVRIRDVVPAFSNTRTTEYPGQEYEVDNGDILVGMDGEFNIAFWRGGRALLNQRVCKITPISVDKDYLFWFLKSKLKKIEALTSAVTVKHLSDKRIKSIVFPVLGKDEQKQIGLRLKTLVSIKNHLQEQLQHLDEQVKSLFSEMFGDVDNEKKTRLGDLCKLINGDRSTNYPKSDEIQKSGDVPFVNAGHISNDIVSFDDMNYIPRSRFDALSSGKIATNDILYCLRGSLGKMAMVDFQLGAIASSLVIIRVTDPRISPVFLFYSLKQPYVVDQMNKANNGSSQPNLSAASVRNYQVFVPSFDKQQVFIHHIEQINKLRFNYQEQINVLQELLDKKMKEYFGGDDI